MIEASGRQTRILFLVSAMSEGGAERVAALLANAWVASGKKVTMVITFSGRGTCHYALDEAVRVVYLSDESGVLGKGLFSYFRRYVALRNLIRRESADIVLSFLTNVNVAALACAANTGCPVVVSERTYPPAYPLGPVLEFLRRALYPAADVVVLQSVEGLKWLEERIPRAQGVVIPNPVAYPVPGAEPGLSPDLVVPHNRKLLLSVGRLHREKGFDLLLAAFSGLAVRHPAWDLVLLGEGPERVALESQAVRLGLEGRVFLPGHFGNVGDWYDRADIYVLSSRFEGFPNSLAEAMAHGCAVVSFDCDTGPRGLISDGEDGLLVSPAGDVATLEIAMDRVMSDAQLRRRLASMAVGVRERYSLHHVLEMWDAVFSRAATGGPGRSG